MESGLHGLESETVTCSENLKWPEASVFVVKMTNQWSTGATEQDAIDHFFQHLPCGVEKLWPVNFKTDRLLGKSIIVLKADLAHDYALAKGWGKQLVLVDTPAKGFRLLASGKHDAILIGKLPGMQTLLALGLTDIKALKVKAAYSDASGRLFRSEPATHSSVNRPPCGKAVACWTGVTLRAVF